MFYKNQRYNSYGIPFVNLFSILNIDFDHKDTKIAVSG